MNKLNLSQDIITRFWSKVNIIPGECWEWIAGLTENGYGQFFYDGKHILSHRFAWQYYYGIIPSDKLVAHHCDNTKCCNPMHLTLSTPKDNSQDMVNKGRVRGGWQPGENHVNTILTNENVKLIKTLINNGYSQNDIAEHFKLSQTSISRIKRGITWKHII